MKWQGAALANLLTKDIDVLKIVLAWIGIVFVICTLTLLILSSDQLY